MLARNEFLHGVHLQMRKEEGALSKEQAKKKEPSVPKLEVDALARKKVQQVV